MAERRMFAKTIIDSDTFLEMPQSTQNLYFHLAMRADDDGFINNPKAIMRSIGCREDDVKVLIGKQFLIPFESGVVVIRHWKIHNYIRSDRYNETKCQSEKKELILDKANVYIKNGMSTCIPLVDKMDTQVRLGKDRLELGKDSIGKDKKEEKKTPFSSTTYIQEKQFSSFLEEKVIEWINYKKERREAYKETGIKSLCTQISNKVNEYGESEVCNLITECMGNGWKGIIWDKLKQSKQNKSSNISNIFYDIGKEEGLF